LRGGGSTLFPEEIELLGDLTGRRLLHLQCNAGQDSLSLAARGAEVVGVDISDEAVEFASRLSAESGVAGRFERADVYDWLAAASAERRRFDIVFSSYGAITWLSDLRAWARGVAAVLAPKGRLVLMEFHPALYMLDEKDGKLVFGSSKGGGGALWSWDPGVHDYVAISAEGLVPWGYERGVEDFANPEPCHDFEWSLADVVDAVAAAGMHIETVREWPYSNGCRFFTSMVDVGERRWALPPEGPRLPLMYGLRARAEAP
jgi:SAM-dependent methyltransferase